MTTDMTPAPVTPMFERKHPPPLTEEINSNEEELAALIGGILGAVLLVFICVIALLLWCLSRHKGSYATNEMGNDDDDIVDDEDEDEDESIGSDVRLQDKEPLKVKEED